ncbi:hypothetical protein KIN20_032541 [Parelaphostrongylus tenuis]|uniref:Uncharacterized protein n=1 Tax=Parelaphostrongylus tenuis TaxID=148309 RepID=A0AAD5R720_PARTN|nr:hypothetical protein KIN20_032541 [Parelaphostrongylus tenuis]
MSDLQRALDFLQKCISIEKDFVWRLSKSDPFAALLLDLESDENGILSFCDEPYCCDAQLAGTSGSFTSQAQRDPTNVFFDVRIRYGRIIMSALRKVAQELSILRDQEESSTVSILSLKHIALISSAFQFFILTCISPYLDKGVGVPLNLRSQIIRSWEMCAGDVGFKSEQLCRAGECITALLNCNSAVRSELLRKYCSDIICVFEQLKCYGPGDMLSQYEDMLAMVPLQLLVCSFLGLVKPRSSAAPTWFIEISNGQFWDNTHLVTVLGKKLSLPPRSTKRMIYYKNISDQFFELLNSGKFSRKKVSLLFSLFCEQLKRINAFAWSIMIEDVLYKPWEVIASSSNFTWSSSHATSLCLLTLWSENRLSSQLLRESPRFLLVATVLLSLLPISSSDMSSSRNLRSDILAVIKFALEQVENLADFFLTFITDPSPCYQLLQEKRLVQVLDEEPQLYGTVVLSTLNQSKDELLGTKIEATVVVLKEFRPMLAGRLFLEIACKSVQKWENDGDLCGLPRFVDHCNLEAADIVSQRTTSHFVAGVVFEQLKDYEIDYFDPEITGLLVNLVEAILSSTIRHLSARRERMSLDVVTENAHDLQLHSVISQNAKMAIGLAGAVVMTARLDERNKSAITQLCSSLSSFIANISKLKCDEEIFDTMVEDARKLLYVFGEDVRYPTPPPAPPEEGITY